MAAHLHRYGSELRSLSEILDDVKWYNKEFHNKLVENAVRSSDHIEHFMRGLEETHTKLSAISRFRDELQLKIENVLNLVSLCQYHIYHAISDGSSSWTQLK